MNNLLQLLLCSSYNVKGGDGVKKVEFPLHYMNIVSKNIGGSESVVLKDSGNRENVYAPFDGIIRKVYKTHGNFVWLESKEKVLWANGDLDYMILLTGGDDNVESLYKGKQIKKGEAYYTVGTSGNTFKHVYLEVGKGQFYGNGWEKNERGTWVLHDEKPITEAFVIGKNTMIQNDGCLDWVYEK